MKWSAIEIQAKNPWTRHTPSTVVLHPNVAGAAPVVVTFRGPVPVEPIGCEVRSLDDRCCALVLELSLFDPLQEQPVASSRLEISGKVDRQWAWPEVAWQGELIARLALSPADGVASSNFSGIQLSFDSVRLPSKKGRPRPIVFLEHDGDGAADTLILAPPRGAVFDFSPRALPLPPTHLMEYDETPAEHLASGERDAMELRRLLLTDGGIPLGGVDRFLDFGCSNGRVLRWFSDWARRGEGWGVDINASTLMWSFQNLRPPFRFAVSTTQPNLFFRDAHFDLAWCYSIFTHVDDLFMSWLCEFARILRPGGHLFLTIQDEASIRLLRQEYSSRWLSRMIGNSPSIDRLLAGELGVVTVSRDFRAQTFFAREAFLDYARDLFDVVSITERTMAGFQTGVLLRRKADL